jgi:hypothetical protein
VPKSQRVSAYLFFFFLVSVAAAALEVGTARSLLSALCSDERPSLSKNHKKKKKSPREKSRRALLVNFLSFSFFSQCSPFLSICFFVCMFLVHL